MRVPIEYPRTRESGSNLVNRTVSGTGGTLPGAGTPAPATTSAPPPAPVPLPDKQYAPAMIPAQVNPLAGFDPSKLAGALGGFSMSGGSEGGWTPMDMDYRGDPEFEAILKARMAGEGVGPSWEDIVSGTYDPYARIIDRETDYNQDQSIESMISRGMLDSGEARKAHAELGLDAQDRKNAYLGQLGMQHEQLKQEGINNALSQYGIIEGNKLSAKATITSANIGAAAQIKSSAIQANATTQSAMISAQARLQEAGLNAGVALASLRQEQEQWAAGEGIDLELFQTDPAYRGVILGIQREWKIEEAELIRLENSQRRVDLGMGPRP
jgi:hypothetical protein